MRRIDGETRVAGIIGYPLRYSLSPVFQNYLFQRNRLNWVYVPFPIREEREVGNVVKALFLAEVSGLNVTIPYKSTVLEVVDELDTLSRLVGAVNTLKMEDGLIRGYNTDGPGFWDGFRLISSMPYSDINLSVLGSGGAAKGITGEAILRGIKRINIFARRRERAAIIAGFGRERGVTIEILPWEEISSYVFPDNSVIVNTTPLGMKGEIIPINWDGVPLHSSIIADAVYIPEKTPFLTEAEKRGIPVLPGYYMLAGQGVKAFEIWTGHRADLRDTALFIRRQLNG